MKNQKLTIPFSQSDIEELHGGEEFNWTFTTDRGEEIDIHIKQEEESDIED